MAGGGRFIIKGGIASKGEARVVDGAVLVTGLPSGSIEHSFLYEDAGPASGNYQVDLLNGVVLGSPFLPEGPGLPMNRRVSAVRVAISIRHSNSPNGGNQAISLWRKDFGDTSYTFLGSSGLST